MDPKRPANTAALIVVDVQNGFVNQNSESILPNVNRLITAWVERESPIYFTKFLNLPGSKWETLIGWRRLRDEPETDLHESIRIHAEHGTIVEKANTYTSVVGAIKLALEEGRLTDVVICGIATESCVLATALQVFEHPAIDARPFVVRDACSSHAGQGPHEAGLLVLERFIGKQQLVQTDDIL